MMGQIKVADLNSTQSYDPLEAYNQSKLANMLFVTELSKRLENTGVTVNAVHPGFVDTQITRHLGSSRYVTRYASHSTIVNIIECILQRRLPSLLRVTEVWCADIATCLSGTSTRQCYRTLFQVGDLHINRSFRLLKNVSCLFAVTARCPMHPKRLKTKMWPPGYGK